MAQFRFQRCIRALCICTIYAIAHAAQAQVSTPMQTGEQIYKQTCIACHATGAANAPKFGDKKTWKPLIAEGQNILTAHAWVGVRGMPAQGGRADLSLEDFSKAVAYMARAADAAWQDPDAAMLKKIRQEVARRLSSLKNKS
ncbi:MAG: c-type cytochrome [Cytophagales bacterium]|nr:c-type cytochrome [Cytophagales bacterium]